jgi:Na+-translocating ferredoxin:NAD+ oxidoreductase subunit B
VELAPLAFVAIAVLLGALLGLAAERFRRAGDPVADAIDRLLPQTQCAQCGFPGCRPYAEAIARGEADIDRCPPGGAAGVAALARLLGRDPMPLDASCGAEKPPQVVRVDEALCIGCTKCIQACPVDAIVGAPKKMHAILEDECTGCELCLPPCPVDCLVVVPRAPALPRRAIGTRATRPAPSRAASVP